MQTGSRRQEAEADAVATLRGAGTLALVALHCLGAGAEEGRPLEAVARHALDVAVPALVFAAGFSLPRNPRAGLGRRLRALLLPYAFASAARFALEAYTATAFWERRPFRYSARPLLSLRATERARRSRAWWAELLDVLDVHADLPPPACLLCRGGVCALKDEMVSHGPRFQMTGAPAPWSDLGYDLVAFRGFGHFASIAVVAQLHALTASGFAGASDASLRKVAAIALGLAPLRALLLDAMLRSDIVEPAAFARLPFFLAPFFLLGFSARHATLGTAERRRLRGRARDAALTALGAIALLEIKRGPRPAVALCREVAAVCAPAYLALREPVRRPAPGPAGDPPVHVLCLDLASWLRTFSSALGAELGRCAYCVFLFHGLFLENRRLPLPDPPLPRFLAVAAASLGVAQASTLLLRPAVARHCFGARPPGPARTSTP